MKTLPQRGFALVGVLVVVALMTVLIAAYFGVTHIESSTTRSSMGSARGFYAAEAGANVRASELRQVFVGYNRPAGTVPSTGGGQVPCEGANQGSGDFVCKTYQFQERDVVTYVEEVAGNPVSIVIPRGELYQNLNAQEYHYIGYSTGVSPDDRTEAVLEVHFKSRLVPMFQFAAFYNKDLEILPGPAMTLAGPVHTNGDLYLGANTSMDILGQVTSVGDVYHGRKNQNVCQAGPVSVIDPENLLQIPDSVTRLQLTPPDLVPWNGMIVTGVDVLTVPPPEALDPTPGQVYWDKADIRIVVDIHGGTPVIRVHDPDGSVDATDTTNLASCGVVTHSNNLFYNHRESTWIEMLDVDVTGLMNCSHAQSLLGPGKDLDDTSEGGLVWHLSVDGPDSAVVNNYGVRVSNGGELASTLGTAPDVRGLTVVTNQAIYVEGDYNAVNKKPAAFLADSLNVLSNNWDDARSALPNKNDRIGTDTTIYAAFMAGTDSTGGVEGSGGQDIGNYNGGLENYPRFHEKWTGNTLTYRGSFVSLNLPLHVNGTWGSQSYSPPNRDWGYDTDFDNAENLPPLSPRFVYLRQELFMRQF